MYLSTLKSGKSVCTKLESAIMLHYMLTTTASKARAELF